MSDEAKPCPSCGHCPTCGNTPGRLAPYYPTVPYYPTFPPWPPTTPIWYSSGTSTDFKIDTSDYEEFVLTINSAGGTQ